ncbi:hypothetical protein GCM10010412_029570 [Nonomuraea recticatena]|uniref:Segregation and condensation protein B n=1 Tax=Nonomuraea recticatena TaxID=46178 RepID=A0ABN3RQT2_9ACTN
MSEFPAPRDPSPSEHLAGDGGGAGDDVPAWARLPGSAIFGAQPPPSKNGDRSPSTDGDHTPSEGADRSPSADDRPQEDLTPGTAASEAAQELESETFETAPFDGPTTPQPAPTDTDRASEVPAFETQAFETQAFETQASGTSVPEASVPETSSSGASSSGASSSGASAREKVDFAGGAGRAVAASDGRGSAAFEAPSAGRPRSGDGQGEGAAVLGDFSWDGRGASAGRPEESIGFGDDTQEPSDDGVRPERGPELRAALEAILIVVDEPVAAITLAQVLEHPTHEIETALRALAAEYSDAGRGFDLREVAGGWRFYTRADCAPLVERFVRDGQQARLTQAALETLAVVAYRQPVSRARVAAVRGVNSDGVMRTLVARGLVEEAGSDPESQAVLYRTSSYFLERLGLKSIDELPELAPFLPDDVENLEETTK